MEATGRGVNVRFQLGLAGILLFFCVIAALLTYYFEQSFYEKEARDKARLVMATVEASRTYIREILRPRMYRLVGPDRFVIEAMSTSYATRVIMERFQDELPDFIYRRAAVNARNPVFEANALERRMIDYFRKNPDKESWFGLVTSEGERRYMEIRPVVFSASCLHCHGRPEEAPATIRQRYGASRGFGRRAGEVAAVQSLAIPAETQMAAMRRSAFQVFSLIVLVVLFLYAVIWIFFDLVVTRRVRSVLSLFRENLQDPEGQAIYRRTSRGRELQDLHRSARMMAAHLRASREQLERYNRELEEMVARRTRDLEQSRNRLHEQVTARNRELALLNTIAELITRSVNLARIVPSVVRAVLEILPARGGGIYLVDREKGRLMLDHQEGAPELEKILALSPGRLDRLEAEPADLATFQHCGQIELTGREQEEDGIRVPLCCRERLLGILVLTGISLTDLDDSLCQLLLSVGRQIGITLESLTLIARLHQSRELLQSVFNAITDPVLLLDEHGRFRMVNQAFLDRIGLEAEQVEGRLPEDLEEVDELPVIDCFRDMDPGQLPLSRRCHDRSGRVHEVIIYPVRDPDIPDRAFVCFARDITEQQLMENRIQQAERLASTGQLAAGVAHELNNPLGVILCYTDLLKKSAVTPEMEADIAVIERQAGSCRRIVSDLLNFARSHTSARAQADLNNLVREVVRMFATRLRHQQVEVRLLLDESLPVCRLDREQIRQVLVNLILNALQATPSRGVITVTTRNLEKDRVELAVADTGTGIARRHLDRIFDPFFTTKGPDEGTGLGLSLSYTIVREHGGTLDVRSEEGQGSVFTMILPVDPEPGPEDS